jgi:serine/threonine-protein kinase
MAGHPNREGDAPHALPDPLLGATIAGRYEVVTLIARGGMGKVYKAQQKALGRVCALKVLSTTYSGNGDPQFHRRFSLEAATVSRLTHANTVIVYDFGKCDTTGVYFIAMEYLDGPTLSQVIRAQETLPEARASHIAQQICRSVDEAHGIGIVHRDLKPGNVMLVNRGDESDFVKVLDFGLVKDVSGRAEELTQGGLFMGSPKYMAPEQVQSAPVTPATDIYSLGIILYEMLSGKTPFDAKGAKILVAHVSTPPVPLRQRNPLAKVSEEMEAIVMRCIEKRPTARFRSMRELRLALVAEREGALDKLDTTESMTRLRSDVLPTAALPAAASETPTVVRTAPSAERETVPDLRPAPGIAAAAIGDAMRDVPRARTSSWTTYAGVGVAALSGIALVALILSQLGGPPQLTNPVPGPDTSGGATASAVAEPPTPTAALRPVINVHFELVSQLKDLKPAAFISGPDPVYTREALAGRVQGTAVARCVIRADGSVTGCRMMRSLMFLDDGILAALASRRFTPTLRFGRAVDEEYLFTVDATLL